MATCGSGHQNIAGAAFCSTCGVAVTTTSVEIVAVQAAPATIVPSPPPVPVLVDAAAGPALPPGQTRGMYTAAAVINWVSWGLIVVFTAGIGLILGAYFIPMTIRMHKNAKGTYKHTSLGVCTLLFCNLISGILILADDSGRPSRTSTPALPPA